MADILRDGFIAIHDDNGKLLMRYNPASDIIEIQRRGVKTNIDLKQHKESAMSDLSGNQLMQLKYAVRRSLVKSDAPFKAEDLTFEECLDFIRDVGFEYMRLKSATSAAQQQGGANGRCTNE